jgi:hypothetical protein
MTSRAIRGTLALVCLLAGSAYAQIGGKPIRGGNPTPGTPQPDPPRVKDRITVTGCIDVASKDVKPSVGVDGNAVYDSRYVLASVERPAKIIYRLAAIESQLSPFAGAKVEISGEPKGTVLQVEFVQKLAASCP